MHVALLHFDGCPNWRIADTRVGDAVARLGGDEVAVTHQPVETQGHAETAGFRGSPTILVDGREAFADPQAPEGFAGAPTVAQLVEVLA